VRGEEKERDKKGQRRGKEGVTEALRWKGWDVKK